jgi:hypothetical protein
LASILRYLSGLKSSGRPIQWMKIHGGPAQRMGEPDLVICDNGRLLVVEVKRPGQKPTPLQEHRLSQWRDSNARVGVVDSVESFAELLT